MDVFRRGEEKKGDKIREEIISTCRGGVKREGCVLMMLEYLGGRDSSKLCSCFFLIKHPN